MFVVACPDISKPLLCSGLVLSQNRLWRLELDSDLQLEASSVFPSNTSLGNLRLHQCMLIAPSAVSTECRL